MTQVSGDIAAIAAGLSSSSRRALTSGYWNVSDSAILLVNAGIVKRTGRYAVELTPLGLAVRAYLEGKSHD